MKILDKIGLIIFSNIVLILSIILCLLIFGWLSPETVYEITKIALNDPVTTKIVLGLAIAFIILAIKCIFFTSEKKQINGIKDGILLQNDDGKLLITKETLKNMVNATVSKFASIKSAQTKIILDSNNDLSISLTIEVTDNAVIKELSNNVQVKVKETMKESMGIDVKNMDIKVVNIVSSQKTQEEK